MVSATVCLSVLLLSSLPEAALPTGDDILAVVHESCRFEVHTSRLQWDSAHQACSQRGLTLASLSDVSEAGDLFSAVKQANSVYSNRFNLESSNYWVGLRRDGDYSYHWGDCVPNNDVTKSFSDLSYTSSYNCGLVSGSSVRMTLCHRSLGFICENPQDGDSCFTTFTKTADSIGYDSVTRLTSSRCASSCLMSDNCAGVFVSSGNMCTMLSYIKGLKYTLASSDLESTHFYHRRVLYTSTYKYFEPHRSVEDICNIPAAIITTAIPETTGTTEINPTTSSNPTTNLVKDTQSSPEVVTIKDGSTNPLSNSSLCVCSCRDDNETETLQQKLQRRKSELAVNKRSVSQAVRRKVSAPNLRKSSRCVGYLGAGIISLSCLLIVSLDLPRFVSEVRKIINKRNKNAS